MREMKRWSSESTVGYTTQAVTSVDDQYNDAAYAYGIGNFEDAAHGFQALVGRQHAPAATYLAGMYIRGEGVSKDATRAVELLEKAIEWGDCLAAFNLGAYYHSGCFGVPQDRAMSRRYFILARKMGCKVRIDDYL